MDLGSSSEPPKQVYTPLDLFAMSAEERNKIIAEQASLATNEDFETFEAYSEEDLDAIP